MNKISDWSKPRHKTKILPLRWIANYIFEPISMYFFNKGLRLNDLLDSENIPDNKLAEIESEMSLYYNLYHYLGKPYTWWGTVYVVDMEKLRELIDDMDLSGKNWDDYDEDGIPYWEKTGFVDPDYEQPWRFVDPWTGDAFRIIRRG